MEVVIGLQSIWILLLNSLQFWGHLSASTSSPALPAAKLFYSSQTNSLVCQAPNGQTGFVFILYNFTKEVDRTEFKTADSEAQFMVTITTGNELFCCCYQNNRGIYSPFSPYLQLNQYDDVPPTPVLVLEQLIPVWHFLCTGSPAYPGAVFSLYLEGNNAPISSQRAQVFNHEVTFQVPVQDSPVALYRCQYSTDLGDRWRSSAKSPPLAVARGVTPATTTGIDWPVVLGSFSASVLFLCAMAVVVVVMRRRVKASEEENKKRQESQFWNSETSVDLKLRCSSNTYQDWSGGQTSGETASRSSLWNSTFTSPSY